LKRKISTATLAFFTLAAAGGMFLVSFFFGGFASHYNSSSCQSELIAEIHKQTKLAESSNNMEAIKKLNKVLSQAESEKYELSCGKLKEMMGE